MTRPILAACTLTCHSSNREFNLDKRHVFKTPSQALMRAEQSGWNVNYQNGHAICRECKTKRLAKHEVKEVGNAPFFNSTPPP